MFIKINNGYIEKYPYSIGELREDNKNISFPEQISDELLQEFGVFEVEKTAIPDAGLDKNVNESTPIIVDGKWKQVWVVTDASEEEILERIKSARASEYPPMSDYLDGIVKNNQEQIKKYIDDCLAVKAKYPKP